MIAALLAAVALQAPMADQTTTASELGRLCAASDQPSMARCHAFLVPGAQVSTNPRENTAIPKLCIPPTATFGDLRRAYSAYLPKHAEKGSSPAVIVVLEMLAETYPCR